MSVIHRHQHEADPTGSPVTDHNDRGPWFDRALATLRIAFGVTFLWAFLDKLLALGFHTGYDQEGTLDRFGPAAWINGGSPTEGFLAFGVPEDNPFKSFFNGMADSVFVEWLFMLGLLGIGISLLLGVAMRFGTAAGALMYAFMYAASLPLENNPVVDDHLVGVIVMAVLALGAAGTTWGLGHWWNRIGVVEQHPVLR
ncbi:thiosulfate dehydrogenase [quinone] large subunit [Nocardioides alpinus]|nr:DoxX family membrane protein [Nocardioides alpinus]SFA78343.1 thiosulfate dehydrogenase [quinone] large subunit [Nocardioides alpinus]